MNGQKFGIWDSNYEHYIILKTHCFSAVGKLQLIFFSFSHRLWHTVALKRITSVNITSLPLISSPPTSGSHNTLSGGRSQASETSTFILIVSSPIFLLGPSELLQCLVALSSLLKTSAAIWSPGDHPLLHQVLAMPSSWKHFFTSHARSSSFFIGTFCVCET